MLYLPGINTEKGLNPSYTELIAFLLGLILYFIVRVNRKVKVRLILVTKHVVAPLGVFKAQKKYLKIPPFIFAECKIVGCFPTTICNHRYLNWSAYPPGAVWFSAMQISMLWIGGHPSATVHSTKNVCRSRIDGLSPEALIFRIGTKDASVPGSSISGANVWYPPWATCSVWYYPRARRKKMFGSQVSFLSKLFRNKLTLNDLPIIQPFKIPYDTYVRYLHGQI